MYQASKVPLIGISIAAVLAASSCLWGGDRPNVLFVAVDDLVPTLGCYGDSTALTPEIDALASQGMTFLNHHCQWAVCGPSRASMATSLMPDETGVIGFKPIRAVLPDVITLPQHFKNQGYETAGTGKFYDPRTVGTITDPNGPTAKDTDDLPSWSIPYVDAASGFSPSGKPAVDDSDRPDSDYGDYKILSEGLDLIDTLAAGGKPFFLAVGFKKPHLPFVAPKRFWDLYDRNSMPLASYASLPVNATSYNQTTLTDNDELLGYEPYDVSGLPTLTQQRELIHGYYACVSMIDDCVGQLRAKLAATVDPLQPGKTLAETTIVVLWGDHGFHLGDHGRWAKHTVMEQGSKCPLIIFDPRSPNSPGSNKTNSPVNSMDIYPTLCELAGISIPDQPLSATVINGRPIKGRSLVPVLEDPTTSVHFGAVTQFNVNGQHGFSYRSERFRLIEWIGNGGTVNGRDLFDYKMDPLETKNLADDPSYAAIVYQLSRALRAETPVRGTGRLNQSTAISAGGDAFVPFVSISGSEGALVSLDWPASGGVSYDILASTTLLAGSWVEDFSDIQGPSLTFPTVGDRRFFRIGFGSNTPPVFSSDPLALPDGQVDQAYSSSLASRVIDPDVGETLTFSKVDGPSWLVVGADGSLSGLPLAADAEASWFTVDVTDSKANSTRAKLQITVSSTPPVSTILEHWAFNDTAATGLSSLINSGPGTAAWNSDAAQVSTNGSGALVFSMGVGASDNVFRSADLSAATNSSGRYSMEWMIKSASISGGDASGANVGFGMRDTSGVDLFTVRLHRQSGGLRLQTRVGTTNTDLQDFGGNSIADLWVRVVADLDADTFDVFWSLGAGAIQSSTGLALSASGLDFDIVRMIANTNTDDWGAGDTALVDFLKISEEP